MAILSKTFGVLLIALFFLLIFYGMVIILAAQYLQTYRSDKAQIRGMVILLLVIGTVQAVTAFTWVYDDLINRFGKVFELDILPPYALVQLMSMYLLVFISQCYFGTRVWILSKRNMYITVPIFISAFVVLVTGIITAVRVGQLGRFSLIIRVKTIVIIQDAAVLLCDFLITTSLSILLHTHRSGIKSTDSLITRIVVACINRGILLFMLAVCSLVLFLTQTRTMLFLLSLLPAGQLYIITVLSMLVSRKSMRSGHSAEIHSLSHLSNSNETYHSNAPRAIAMTASQIGNHGEAKIQVTQSVLTSWDERGKNAEPSDDVSEPEP